MPPYDSARRTRIALGILRGLLAFVFLTAGLAKLAGFPPIVTAFEHIGLGQWFRYVTGTIEAGSAVLLLIRRLVGAGALLLVCTMIGAVLAHLTVAPGSFVPATVLLILSASLAFVYRDQTLGFVRAHLAA